MTDYNNNGEGGTNGTTVTSANSGGASGDAWTAVTIGAGASLIYDNAHAAHGSLSYRIGSSATGVATYLQMTITTTGTIAFRLYVYLAANPSNPIQIFGCYSGSTVRVRSQITGAGKLTINSTAGGAATMTSSIPLNQWFRVEGVISLSTTLGAATITRFDSMDSTTPSDSISQSGQNYGGTTANVLRIGQGQAPSGATPSWWLDDIGLNDTGTAIGPVAGGPVASPGQFFAVL